jgi:hypothetical protein
VGNISRYSTIPPVRFRVGDIVKAKATFMLIPLRDGHFKMTAVLHSLTLLDTSFALVNTVCTATIIAMATDKKGKQTSVSASSMCIKKLLLMPTNPLKRSITYVDEDEEELTTHKKMTNISIPEGITTSAQANSSEKDMRKEQNKGKHAEETNNKGTGDTIAEGSTPGLAQAGSSTSHVGDENAGTKNMAAAGVEIMSEESMVIDG